MSQIKLAVYRGLVKRGKGRGKRLGFPTANIPCIDETLSGTYAGVVTLAGVKYPAAVYSDIRRGLLEAHILNFDRDIYGEKIEIELLASIVGAKQYSSDKELQRYIAHSVAKVQRYFQQL